MGKKAQRAENEAFAKARYIRGSERKLNLIAQMIRGKSAARALVDLEFSRRRMSNDVKKVLESAIANAENNHGLDVDRLFVKEAHVGRTMAMKRYRPRARGRAGSIEKPFSNITIILQEATDDMPAPAKKKAPKAKANAKPESEKKAAPKKKEAAKPKAKAPAAKKTETKKEAGE